MIGIENLSLFIVSTVIFITTPGIDTIFLLNKSLSEGRKSGFYALLGVLGGTMVHTLFAALGISVIIAKSVVVFSIIKYLGAAYLIFLGIKALYSKNKLSIQIKEEYGSNWSNFRMGLFTNILNPKVALFFLSFFPQFINVSGGKSPSLSFLTLGLICAFIGFTWGLFLVYFSSYFSHKINGNLRLGNWVNRFSGSVFILLGIKIALTRK